MRGRGPLCEHGASADRALDAALLGRAQPDFGRGKPRPRVALRAHGAPPLARARDPGLGAALLALDRAPEDVGVPAYAAIPDVAVGGGAGFLGATCLPFETGREVLRNGGRVRALQVPRGAKRRLALLDELDGLARARASDAERALADVRRRARGMVYGPEARAAFALSEEKPATRQRFGTHELGRACLLARRLVERGSRVVLVRDRAWDMHQQIHRRMTYGFPGKLPGLDQAFSALLEDLEARGLHERVSVLLVSEFGRTPRINPAGGRDHWPRVHSAVLYGAGVRRGVVLGASDARGEEPAERPVAPSELFATLAHLLEIPRDAQLWTSDGRPRRVVEDGVAPLSEILAT